jgi:hypothetical protein
MRQSFGREEAAPVVDGQCLRQSSEQHGEPKRGHRGPWMCLSELRENKGQEHALYESFEIIWRKSFPDVWQMSPAWKKLYRPGRLISRIRRISDHNTVQKSNILAGDSDDRPCHISSKTLKCKIISEVTLFPFPSVKHNAEHF